jgi:hypothetical protein
MGIDSAAKPGAGTMMETIPKMIVKNKIPFLIAFLLSVSWMGKNHIFPLV